MIRIRPIIRPRVQPVRRVLTIPKSHPATIADVLVNTSYFVGKTFTLFTMFYCALNWLYYKDLNKDE